MSKHQSFTTSPKLFFSFFYFFANFYLLCLTFLCCHCFCLTIVLIFYLIYFLQNRLNTTAGSFRFNTLRTSDWLRSVETSSTTNTRVSLTDVSSHVSACESKYWLTVVTCGKLAGWLQHQSIHALHRQLELMRKNKTEKQLLTEYKKLRCRWCC